jgi:hypothetical protein
MLNKVKAGSPLRIPAADYNAFVDAAIAAKRGHEGMVAGQGRRIVEMWLGVIVVEGPAAEANYTDARYWVRRVFCKDTEGEPTTSPTFEEMEPLVEGDYTGIWVTATNLVEVIAGSHELPLYTPVLVHAIYDQQAPAIKRYWFNAGGGGLYIFPVYCEIDGGTTDGDAENQCDRTYTVKSLEGDVLLSEATPEWPRPDVGQLRCNYVVHGRVIQGSMGLGYMSPYEEPPVPRLLDAGERLVSTGTGESGKFQVEATGGGGGGATGSVEVVTDIQFDYEADELQHKTRTLTIVNGLITVIGEETDWTPWAYTELCGGG